MKKSITFITLLIILTLIFQTILLAKDEPSIHSEAGIIIDADTGQIIYHKNPHKKLNPASITKLLTALVALDSLDTSASITFSNESIDSLDYGSSRIGIKEGEIITVEDALHGLLLMSANEVANAIAEASSGSINDFVIEMNSKAKELGAVNSNFKNPHGLFDSEHKTTVYDMAIITKELIKNAYFLEIMGHTMYQIPPTNKADEIRYLSQQHKMLNNKNDMRIYRDDVIAGKVGYTRESGHTLITAAQQDGRTLITVTMNTDAHHVYSDTEKLLDYGFGSFTKTTIEPADIIKTIKIAKDNEYDGTISMSILTPVGLLLPEGSTKESLDYVISIHDNLNNEVSKGDVAGSCDIQLNETTILSLPLNIKSIDIAYKNIKTIEVPDTKEQIEFETTPPIKEKKSTTPLLLIVIIFAALSFICIPKKSLFSK